MFKSSKDTIRRALAGPAIVLVIVVVVLLCVKVVSDGTLVKQIIELKVWELGLTVFVGCFLANLFT